MDITIGRLERIAPLSYEERRALRTAFSGVRELAPGEDLLRQGGRPGLCGAVVSGIVARHQTLADGGRQIIALLLPGDLFEFQTFTLGRMDHSVGALTPALVATATHNALAQVSRDHPPLSMLFWREAMAEAAILREWVVNCGRRNAYARTAHLFCELYVRMSRAGLVKQGAFPLPLTQATLSDATGLSVVHVNRVLQQLRADGLIGLRSGRLTVRDWPGLVAAAGFDPTYLHDEDAADPRAELSGDGRILGSELRLS